LQVARLDAVRLRPRFGLSHVSMRADCLQPAGASFEIQPLHVAVVDQAHAPADGVWHIRDERALLAIVRAPFRAEPATKAVAHVERETFRRQAERAAAAFE